MNKLRPGYLDETDQTSCTAWNYHGSGIGNVEPGGGVPAQLPPGLRLGQAAGPAELGHLLSRWCTAAPRSATTRKSAKYLLDSAELRERVKKILAKLGRLVDGKLLIPEEIVHYSEWVHVMRDRIAERQTIDVSNIRATIHPACHVYKMVPRTRSTTTTSSAATASRSPPASWRRWARR
jgi:heterodisulfide reductase subunit B2